MVGALVSRLLGAIFPIALGVFFEFFVQFFVEFVILSWLVLAIRVISRLRELTLRRLGRGKHCRCFLGPPDDACTFKLLGFKLLGFQLDLGRSCSVGAGTFKLLGFKLLSFSPYERAGTGAGAARSA